MEQRVDKRLQSFLVRLNEARLERLKLTLSIEALLQLLHVRVLALAVNGAHFHEVLAFVVKVAHDVLQCVLAETIEQGLGSLDGCLRPPS